MGLYVLFFWVLAIWDLIEYGDPGFVWYALGYLVVVGGLAALGWRYPLAAGLLALVPGTFPIGVLGLIIGYAWLAVMAGPPAVIGVLFVAAGIVKGLTRRRRRLDATA